MPEYSTKTIELFQSLSSSSLVLTPNQRLSRYLHVAYAHYQQEHRHAVSWPSLNCIPRSAWFKQLWQQVQLNALHPKANWRLLTSLQEQALWHDTLNAVESPWPLLQQQQMEQLAAEAWKNLRLWCVSPEHIKQKYAGFEESELLLNWVQHYESRRERDKLVDQAALQNLLLESLDELALPTHLHLYGFEKHEPLFSQFLKRLQNLSIEIATPSLLNATPATAQRYCAQDAETELLDAARWAAAINEQVPSAKIAVVIPELNSLHDKVEGIFNRVFNPQFNHLGYTRHAPVFNISAAKQLKQTPPIAAALFALELNRFELPIESFTAILHSVFLGDFASLNARVRFADELQRDYQHLPTRTFRSRLADAQLHSPQLETYYKQCSEFFACARASSGNLRTATEWLELFQAQLQVLGWPGTRTPDTLEYQQLAQWQQVLDTFAAMDMLGKQLTLQEALSFLQDAACIPFHAQTQDSPVQVLGLLEAAGLHFDYIWLAQLDDNAWPPPPSPNALLPLALQTHLHMPRASSEGELRYAQGLMHTLLHSTTNIIFSYAKQGQADEQQASPLIQAFPELVAPHQVALYTPERAQLDTLEVDEVSALPSDKRKGGTHILKDYAACPFRAFARYRLQANNVDPFKAGIHPIDRGNLLHESLDSLWFTLQNQHSLLSQSESETDALVEDVIHSAWQKVFKNKHISSSLKNLEITRSKTLILKYLALEKQRANFSVVERERTHEMQIGEMPIRMRYDRIDKLDDGSLVVIDYKSSASSNISQWSGDRPDEPQVPLYALANREHASAAAFVMVSARKTAFEGIENIAGTAPKLKTPAKLRESDFPNTWEAILTHWENALSELARKWLAGDVPVAPKKPKQTCQYCDLHALCRIKDFAAPLLSEEDARDD